MASEIKSIPSMGGTTLPANAGSIIRGEEFGIDNTLANCIIQSESITEERITDTTQDQKGAVVSQLDYDEHFALSLTVLCDSATAPITGTGSAFQPGDTSFSYNSKKWKLTSVTYTGSYNGKKQYQINAERWRNFPAA